MVVGHAQAEGQPQSGHGPRREEPLRETDEQPEDRGQQQTVQGEDLGDAGFDAPQGAEPQAQDRGPAAGRADAGQAQSPGQQGQGARPAQRGEQVGAEGPVPQRKHGSQSLAQQGGKRIARSVRQAQGGGAGRELARVAEGDARRHGRDAQGREEQEHRGRFQLARPSSILNVKFQDLTPFMGGLASAAGPTQPAAGPPPRPATRARRRGAAGARSPPGCGPG